MADIIKERLSTAVILGDLSSGQLSTVVHGLCCDISLEHYVIVVALLLETARVPTPGW